MSHDQNFKNLIDLYAALDDQEQESYRQRYPEEFVTMSRFSERLIEQGMQRGIQQGRRHGLRQGEALVLLRLLSLKFGAVPEEVRSRIEAADDETLLVWSERILTADSINEVMQRH
jgi:predicted transposase YdaD